MIVLYTTHCPACKILETKLKSKGVAYEVNESEEAIRDLGYTSAPLLQVDGEVMEFATAVQYVNTI